MSAPPAKVGSRNKITSPAFSRVLGLIHAVRFGKLPLSGGAPVFFFLLHAQKIGKIKAFAQTRLGEARRNGRDFFFKRHDIPSHTSVKNTKISPRQQHESKPTDDIFSFPTSTRATKIEPSCAEVLPMRYLFALIVATLIPVDRHLTVPVKDDVELLQGAWVLVHVEREHPIFPDKMLGTRAVINGAEYKRVTNDDPPIVVRTFQLIANTDPKGIDLVAKNDDGSQFIYKGIYEIKGETFRFCFPLASTDRPKEFRIGAGSTANTITTYRLINRMR
jgi:uncharacterized protein (TIGR03067 family)